MTTPALATDSEMLSEVSDMDRNRIESALADSRAGSTRRNYAREWVKFQKFCRINDYADLPADVDVVCKYLVVLEETFNEKTGCPAYAVSTIEGALAAIKFVHRKYVAMPAPVEGKASPPPIWEHPKVSDMMSAIKRRDAARRMRPKKQANPLLLEHAIAMVDEARRSAGTWRERLRERRDTAVILIGWAGAMRRSEIMSLQVNDVRRTKSGWIIDLSRSKVDQAGKGLIKALPTGTNVTTCGPCAYVRWVQCVQAFDDAEKGGYGRSGLIRLLARPTPSEHICATASLRDSNSPLFRGITRHADIADAAPGGQLVHKIVRQRLEAARPDLDVTQYGAHSLRAGFVTEGFNQGKAPRTIMRQTGHRTMSSLFVYGREADAWENNAVTDIGM